ncbi:exonuclease domain-containing protein [Cupriavidus necator]|uniref:3'-5' exonuclease n=1 Tax=Cupriavidus necator TaxID=106590 RepID=UPI003ECC2141
MIRKWFSAHRFGVTLALLFLVQLFLVGAILLSLAVDLPEAQRAWLGALLLQRGALWIALASLLLFALGFGLKALFDAYPTPLARLAEDAVLLAANPGHRIAPQGAREVRILIDKVNLLAASHQALHGDVQEKIELANRALAEEKNRLAALMAELALSVLVCNIEGRILLYNDSARQLLEAGRGNAPAAGSAAIGLGRSVFGVIERGLILHALEQIQHQLREPGDGVARPVSGFVATLSQGQIVRAHMVPVFDSAHALNGFVLTLEDITRNVEADSRRDALLQSLTQDARATLANIRTAVETIQTFPEMSGAKRTQLTGIIDDESKRLVCQIGRAVDQRGADMDGHQELEEMRGADLLALLLRRIGSPTLSVATSDTVDATLWLKVDSYALTQALAYLAQRLATEAGVTELCFGLYRAGRLAHLDLTWRGAPLTADTLRVWENAPLQISATGTALSLSALIARQGGEAVCSHGPSPDVARYRLMLLLSEPRSALDIPPAQEGRPEFYDFDLFHQPGQNTEIDQCRLSQLNYTVFDTETTGLEPAAGDEIISIGALRIVNGRLLQRESFDQLIRPRGALSAESIAIHGITHAMLNGQPSIEIVLPQFHRFAADTVLVAHNAAFDMKFLQMVEERTGTAFTQPVLDTLLLSQVIHPNQAEHTLEAIASRLGVAIIGRHTALGDAIVTGEIFLKMTPLLAEKGIFTLKDARDAAQQTLYARIRY